MVKVKSKKFSKNMDGIRYNYVPDRFNSIPKSNISSKKKVSSKNIIKFKSNNCSVNFSKNLIFSLSIFLLLVILIQSFTIVTITNSITGGLSNTGEVSLCFVHGPSIENIPNQNATVGNVFTYQANCSSHCGEPVFYAGTSIQMNSFFINQTTGLINFTPQLGEDGNHLTSILCTKNGFDDDADSELFWISVNDLLSSPVNFGIFKNVDNVSVDLNWSIVSGALSYNIYYSFNATQILELDLDNIGVDVSVISDITSNNWTDNNSYLDQTRYYRISSVSGSSENLGDKSKMKHTYYLVASGDGVYGSNLISKPTANLTLESFLQVLPPYIGPSPAPQILFLDRSNPAQQPWRVHIKGWADGYENYTMNLTQGYFLIVNQSHNMTIIGDVETNVTINYVSSEDGVYGSNLIGVPASHYTLETFLQEFPANVGPSPAPQALLLDRSNPAQQPWRVHIKGWDDSYKNYTMKTGEGYFIIINESFSKNISYK